MSDDPIERRVLVAEPWDGGSHALFLDQWTGRTRHRIDRIGLPARHWKWRMRSAPWEIAARWRRLDIAPPDVLFASDYVDLPALYGQLPELAGVPSLLYMHENQVTYPGSDGDADAADRDHHYGFTNILSCVRADRVAFNSTFHRDDFLAGALERLARLPTPNPTDALRAAIDRAVVVAPGVDLDAIPLGPGGDGPLRLLFSHRWEHDKDPGAFLQATRHAIERRADLELVLLGETFTALPRGVPELLEVVAPHVVHRGTVDREEYRRRIGACDVVVSTARHEFFGMAVVEAMAAGCVPLLPDRLSHPELVTNAPEAILYREPGELVDQIVRLAREPRRLRDPHRRRATRDAVARFDADATAARLDAICNELATGGATATESRR